MKDIMLKVKVAPAPMGEDALAAQDEADLAAEEAKSAMEELQAMNEQQFSYESLNDVLLKASLTESWNRKDWPAVRKILFGWGGNLFLFITMIFLGLFYTCELFEPELDDDKQIIVYPPPPPPQPPALPGLNASECFNVTECNFTSPDRTPGPVSDLWIQWSLSGFQRFILHEPTLILTAKGLPIMFASAFCANCCGEVIVNLLSLIFVSLITICKEIRG